MSQYLKSPVTTKGLTLAEKFNKQAVRLAVFAINAQRNSQKTRPILGGGRNYSPCNVEVI
jgi:hypothetical protein